MWREAYPAPKDCAFVAKFPDESNELKFSAAAGCLEKLIGMSYRKVYGGTPVGSESRCDTCTHARIIQGYAESERIVFCDAMFDPIRIPFKVMQCSDYEDKRLPDFEQMAEIAWQIRSKSAGHKAGFILLSDLGKQQRHQGDESREAPAATAENE